MDGMTMTHRKTLGLALAATLTLGACADQGPDLTDQLLTLNAAMVAADATLEVVTLTRTPFSFAPGTLQGMEPGGGMGPRGGMGPAGRPGGDMGFGGSLTGTRSVTFYDATGKEQAAYDSLTTARIHLVLDIAGDVERGGWSGSISRTRDMTITGLAGVETTRTFSGTGTEDVQRSRTLEDGTQASFDMAGSFTNENLVVPVPGSDKKYPLSGKITRDMTVTVVNGPKGDETRKVTVVITFDGDNTATAVVNGETHEIDLDARPGAFPFREGMGGFGRGKRGP
jgi:hypothetical protein